MGLGHFDAAIEETNKAIDADYRVFLAYTELTVGYALKGNLEEAKAALAEARRLNPKLTVPDEGLRKAGLPEAVNGVQPGKIAFATVRYPASETFPNLQHVVGDRRHPATADRLRRSERVNDNETSGLVI